MAKGAQDLGTGLKPRHVSMIAFGGIIGAGLFVGSSTTINMVGPAAVFSYSIAGIIILCVMRMISEIASSNPGIRSFPDFARRGLGPAGGFISGWLYWYFWVIVVAIEALAGAKIINSWMPEVPVWAIGISLIGILATSNALSVRAYGEFEFWLSSIKVAAIIAFIALSGAWVAGLTPHGGSAISNLIDHGGLIPNGPGAILAAIASTIFALCGAEIATIAAAESEDSTHLVSRLAMTVIVRIVLFYVVSIALIVTCVPWTQIKPGYSPFATALSAIGIPYGDTIMTAVVLIAVLSCLNSGLYVTSRTLFDLGRHGDAPNWLVRVSSSKVPIRSLTLASSFSLVALAADQMLPKVVFSFLVNASGVIMLILYAMVAWSQFRLRSAYERVMGEAPKVRMWLFPYATILSAMAILGVVAFMAFDPQRSPEFWASMGTLGLASAVAWLRSVKRKPQGST